MTATRWPSRRRRVLWTLFILWLGSTLASQVWWHLRPFRPQSGAAHQLAEVAAVGGDQRTGARVQLAYQDLGSRDPQAPVLVLLHGSPGSMHDFDQLAGAIPPDLRVIIPDLPGFGQSDRRIPDFSAHAHSIYLDQLLEQLKTPPVHLVAFSMGGAVALELADRSPQLVASISMVSALGVEELELFGRRDLNHLLHGVQLTLIDALALAVPHFGGADHWVLGPGYAQNFFDTDQSRIRGCLERWEGPMLIVHGIDDFLVPVEAAREHHRIVPQSQLVELDASHFILWTRMEDVKGHVERFVRETEAGRAQQRDDASPERIKRAEAAFDPSDVPPASGPTLLVLMLLFILGTLISEDLTSVAAGLLVAQGRLEFLPAVAACCFGVYIGDMGLFLTGRWLGRPVVERRPLRWFLTPVALERASAWLRKNGVKTIFLSRLMPGLRLPTYFAAGVLKTRLSTFAFYFLVAVLIWTPILVAISAFIGAEALALFDEWGAMALIGLLILILLVERVVIRLFTFRGRRSLVGSWMRWTRWEFWPPWMFYPPIALHVVWLALKHRSPTLFTAANPAIPTGGFIGESKSKILAGLDSSRGQIARYQLLEMARGAGEREQLALDFLLEIETGYPVVLKPDVGQRGSGVRILKSEAELLTALSKIEVDHILQEFVPGPEFGVFYLRIPGAECGRIFSITEKRLPELRGDGHHTLEELILLDPRAVAMASTYTQLHAAELDRVPEAAERIELVELGTHCRGAIFINGQELLTPALEDAFEELSRSFEGFYFGRYDLRAESEELFREGRGFKVIELNGVTSEATHIYDSRVPLTEAWRVLREQWRLAFEIGAANVRRGARCSSVRELLSELSSYRSSSQSHRN